MQACRLAATDLACRRGDRVLFQGLSLALNAGAALQVAGPNGVGKSSLLRVLAGLLVPLHGHVERQGATGLIDERAALDPHLPLDRALAFWGRFDAVTAEPYAQLGLAGLGDVPVRYLSTGQRKRAALARLLGQVAPIWLLDEPLNGLDRAGAALVETLAAEHCAGGGICVIASHQAFALPGMDTLELAQFSPQEGPS
ncbi:MAG: heme ABC exporter ATP-binding protein CcmA [Novosphingobium sp.]|nr:heme ABC exporter ATP-binding protein CcmA [Novosphingobium sp.]